MNRPYGLYGKNIMDDENAVEKVGLENGGLDGNLWKAFRQVFPDIPDNISKFLCTHFPACNHSIKIL